MKKIIGILIATLFLVSAYSGATTINDNNRNLIDRTSIYYEPTGESIKSKINQDDCILLDNILICNDPPGEWIKTYGEKKSDDFTFARMTDDGGYIATGYTISYAPGDKPVAWLVKTDSDGVMEWNKTYGTDDDNACIGHKVFQTTDGGYIIVGYKGYYIQDCNAWLIKTDENGKVEWESTFGGIDFDRCFHVVEVDDGYFLCGRTCSSGAGDADGWIIKTDTNGKKLWDKTYGGTYYDNFYAMVKLDGGGFVLTGISYSYNVHNYADFWCVKIDGNGNEVWSKTYGGSANYTAWSVNPTVDGGYIIGGHSTVYNAQKEFWFDGKGVIAKIDGSGTMQWMKNYSNKGYDLFFWMDPTNDGGYILTGVTTINWSKTDWDIWLVKTDGSGNMEWQRTIKQGIYYDRGNSVQQVTDTSYIIAGSYRSFSKSYAFLQKTINTPPLKPDIPTGEINGKVKKEYMYTTDALDQNSDQIFYLFDWGDGTNSSWIGPYNSGESVGASHKWTNKSSYEVRVKAKDIYDLESLWSDPLEVSMPKSKPYLASLEERFPLLFNVLSFPDDYFIKQEKYLSNTTLFSLVEATIGGYVICINIK